MHIKHSGQRPITIRPTTTTTPELPTYPGAVAWTGSACVPAIRTKVSKRPIHTIRPAVWDGERITQAVPEHIAQAASIREALREAARQERANTFINPVTNPVTK